jgi:diguanylate cyclase (GGDEF)-like protein
MSSHPPSTANALSPDWYSVDVFSELPEETVCRRWRDLNVLLRASMLSALSMQMDATLNLICDFCAEIVSFDRGAVFFWDEEQQVMHVRVSRRMPDSDPAVYSRAQVLNFLAAKAMRPLLVSRGRHPEGDALLESLHSASALVLPLSVENRVLGSLQFYSDNESAFTAEDAQLLWILVLVTENLLSREYANEALLRFAFTDFLTGMKTRGYFEQQLELELKRTDRRKSSVALLMIDIDLFKQINDTFGHHVGDQILRDISTILMKDMREIDTVARYGGEEFVIVLPETDERGAMQVAQRLRRAVAAANFFAGSPNEIRHLTISIGLAVSGQDALHKRELIESADAALYEAKARNRNQVIAYSSLKRTSEAS